MAEWVEYATKPNGDILFFDSARLEKNEDGIKVWTRVLYKTSVMGASSYQSLLNIECTSRYQTVLQNTFYSDKDWTTPAMATNTKAKPRKSIKENSTTDKLANILCKE